MKTTSYEISKKLHQAGFKPKNEEDRIWNYKGQQRDLYPAYDLETIIEALPKFLSGEQLEIEEDSCYYSDQTPLVLSYSGKIAEFAYLVYSEDWDTRFEIQQEEGESLADTAARLLLLLHKKGIIKLREQT